LHGDAWSLDVCVEAGFNNLVGSLVHGGTMLDDGCSAADQVDICAVETEHNRLGAGNAFSAAWNVLCCDSECATGSLAAIFSEHVRARSLELVGLTVERDVVAITVC
jgi:hypothetical protein